MKHVNKTGESQNMERERRVASGIRASKNVHMKIERGFKGGKYRQTET